MNTIVFVLFVVLMGQPPIPAGQFATMDECKAAGQMILEKAKTRPDIPLRGVGCRGYERSEMPIFSR